MTYFKYTNGEAFTLNNSDYTGFFNVNDNIAYSGKIKDDFSEKLTPKNNFISNFYLKKLHFNNQVGSIREIEPFLSQTFDILNKDQLDKIFEVVNDNNLKVFKSLITSKPEIVNFDNNSSHFYGLSTTQIDDRNDDEIFGKNVISHIDPFRFSDEWAFLENIKYSALFVDSEESFKYLCSDGDFLYTIKGSFSNRDKLVKIIQPLGFAELVFGINYDEYKNQILILVNNVIRIYDAINYIECDELILIDEIILGGLETLPLTWGAETEFSNIKTKFSRTFYNLGQLGFDNLSIGKNFRVITNGTVVEFRNKYSSDLIISLNLENNGVEDILAIDCRYEDDFCAILHKKDNYHLIMFNPYDVEPSYQDVIINDVLDSSNYRLKFSPFDSDIIFIISSGETQVRYLSNPRNSASRMREKNLKYPPKITFGDMFQRFGDSNLKWNTNTLDSNFFTNKTFNIITRSNKNYYILQNSGRIYALNQQIIDFLQNSIPLNVEKSFDSIQCGKTSFGLFFNKNISSVMKDLLTLYTKASNSYKYSIDNVIPNTIDEIDYDINNLFMNGNETVNVITMQRIFNNVLDVQKKLLANLTT